VVQSQRPVSFGRRSSRSRCRTPQNRNCCCPMGRKDLAGGRPFRVSSIEVLSQLDDTTPVTQRRVTGLAFQGPRSFPVFGRVGVLTSLPFHEQRIDPQIQPLKAAPPETLRNRMESNPGIVKATKPSAPSKNREGAATRKTKLKGCATRERAGTRKFKPFQRVGHPPRRSGHPEIQPQRLRHPRKFKIFQSLAHPAISWKPLDL
jgi:hypothetical protein